MEWRRMDIYREIGNLINPLQVLQIAFIPRQKSNAIVLLLPSKISSYFCLRIWKVFEVDITNSDIANKHGTDINRWTAEFEACWSRIIRSFPAADVSWQSEYNDFGTRCLPWFSLYFRHHNSVRLLNSLTVCSWG